MVTPLVQLFTLEIVEALYLNNILFSLARIHLLHPSHSLKVYKPTAMHL